MKATTKLLSLIGAAAMAGTASAVNVTIDKVQQRYPWNGLVDIDYTLDGGVSVDTKFQVTVTAEGKTYSATTFKQDFGLTRGKHRITWDTAADNAKFFSKNATVKMSLVDTTGTFYIFDLVNGGAPVITNCTVEAFSDDIYKTDKLVMRKLDGGTFTYTSQLVGGGAGTRSGSATVGQFLCGIYEITRKQWFNIMGSYTQVYQQNAYTNTLPVSYVSYDMIRGTQYTDGDETKTVNWPTTGTNVGTYNGSASFMAALRAKIGNGYLFDLPTDRQQQFAYRGGKSTVFYDGCDDNSGSEATYKTLRKISHSWLTANEAGFKAINMDGATAGPAMVGCYAANSYGIYDLDGNQNEWQLDWAGDVTTDTDLETGPKRLYGAGYWGDGAGRVRYHGASGRYAHVSSSNDLYGGSGFRVVSSIP